MHENEFQDLSLITYKNTPSFLIQFNLIFTLIIFDYGNIHAFT